MRRLGDGVEAALHCALVLCWLEPGKVMPGKSLAEMHGLSESYLLKHMRALTEAGLVEALPGPRGGYRLARQPGEITLLDIVEAIDGKEPAFTCKEIRQRGPGKSKDPCAYRTDCFIKRRMLAAEELWRQSLRAQTLADLAQDGDALIDAESKKTIAAFVRDAQR
ncbi:Rrf2 family transcriptional regulator [Xanthobacter sp. 126]|uniref:Rrf2 family transcriptional regulator n=1 Tax=Xanthobacter sp. 126 TaxID=1131814 RepID=UPI00045EB4C2|nr:Rrf2 family transcriptional regulator [Xanthobacter sp. 126]